MLVAGLDVGGSSVKAWVAELDRPGVLAQAGRPLDIVRPGPFRAEVDPQVLEAACRAALSEVVARVARPAVDYLGVTVCTLRQGFVLVDGAGAPLGLGILNSDRRGAPYAEVLAGRYGLTGHWPAPELTLPKLLAVRAEEPERWAATARVLFVHDWLLWRMCGEQVTEGSYACAGGMADVARRAWAVELLEETGVGTSRLAPWVEAGTLVGELGEGWGLPATLPVIAGSGDTQLAAMSAGGLGDGVITVVAGSSTPVQVATTEPVEDPLGRPWVSTHARRGLWAAEGNAGYPGTTQGWWDALTGPAATTQPQLPGDLIAVTAPPYWSRETWEHKPPVSLVGLRPDSTAQDVRAALAHAHAFSVRGNIDDLERALGRPATAIVVTGGGAQDGVLPALLAAVLGRDVHCGSSATAAAGVTLVATALGAHAHPPGLPEQVVPAGDPTIWQSAYERWVATTEALTAAL